MKKVFMFLGFMILLSCGGSGEYGGPVPSTESPAGLWAGTAGTDALIGAVAENGQSWFVNSTTGNQYCGKLADNGNNVFAGQFKKYPTNSIFGPRVSVSLAAKQFNALTGTIDNLSVSLIFDNLYLRPSSLSLLAGNWLYQHPTLGNITTTITAAGAISGSATGTISVINPSFNLYAISVTYQGDDYTGLGFLGDIKAQNDTLIVGGSTGGAAFVYAFTRQ